MLGSFANSCQPEATGRFHAMLRSKSHFREPMLLELRLENYAVILNLAVDFASGLNLLRARPGPASPS